LKNKHIQFTTFAPPTTAYFNRVNQPCRKVLPTLKQRIQEMFNYGG